MKGEKYSDDFYLRDLKYPTKEEIELYELYEESNKYNL